jgi:carbonic anhydrase
MQLPAYGDDAAPDRDGEQPATAARACELLLEGNRWFVRLGEAPDARTGRWHLVRLDAADSGISAQEDAAPAHTPFAAVLGCSDARVPAELVLGRAAGDLFIVRVAGNVPGTWSIGSIDFAVDKLATVRLLAVVGHTSCQAVGAAVDACLAPASYLGVAAQLPLRAIIDSLLPAVVCAQAAMAEVYGAAVTGRPGYRNALVELSVILNAALTANVLRQSFAARLGATLDVVYGVYHLKNRIVGLPTDAGAAIWTPALAHPPHEEPDVVALGRDTAVSGFIAALLGAATHGDSGFAIP